MLNEFIDELLENIIESAVADLEAGRLPTPNPPPTITEKQCELLITMEYNELTTIYEIKNDFCPLYQNKFLNDSIVTVLPCGHCFSHEPIMQWLKNKKAECPLCKYTFPN